MHHSRIIILLFCAGCVPCDENGEPPQDDIGSCWPTADDEAGSPNGCGWLANDRGIVVMLDSCATTAAKVKSELGFVPLTEDATCVPDRVWECATLFETVDSPFSLPVMCGYCSEYDYSGYESPAGIGPAPFDGFDLCYPRTEEWVASTLLGRIGPPSSQTGSACEEIEPPIGYDTEYPFVADCWAGVSCLRITEGCGCKCRDKNGSSEGWPYVDDFFGSTLVDGWEITCSGEPLVWHYPSQSFVGSTIEADGWEPNFPPNNEAQ